MYFNLKKKHIHFHTWIYEAALHAAVLFTFFIILFSTRGFAVGVSPHFYFALPPGHPSTLPVEPLLFFCFFCSIRNFDDIS